MRLLLIEDEEDAARMIAKGLRQESQAVDVASYGQSGLEKALSHPYDLIILDIRLPIKDGWTVCRELREALLQTPILMLTASGAYEDRVKGRDSAPGADDYLVKPFDINELLARVRALLRRRPLLAAARPPHQRRYARNQYPIENCKKGRKLRSPRQPRNTPRRSVSLGTPILLAALRNYFGAGVDELRPVLKSH